MSLPAGELAAALAAHRTGRLDEAERLYRAHLAGEPDDALALHNLGVIANGRGDPAGAVRLIGRALELRPRFAAGHTSHGNALAALGKFAEAEASFRQALALAPKSIDALAGLAGLHKQCRRWLDAIAAWRAAMEVAPDRLELRHNLGLALADAGRLDEGIAEIEAVVGKRSDFAAAHNNLCALLRQAQRLPDAIAAGAGAVALAPLDPTAHYNLAMAQADAGGREAAIAGLERAIALRPGYAEALNALGLVHRDGGDFELALAWLNRAVAAAPRNADMMANIGATLQEMDRLEEAIDTYRRALALEPERPEIHLNLGLALLTAGRFIEGWQEYEWRTRCAQSTGARPEFVKPAWDCGNPADMRILLHAEQGHGDTIQFLRYAPLVKAAGAAVIVECQPALYRLASRMSGIDIVVARGEPLPVHDLHAPLLSLPRLLETDMSSIPSPVGYVSADPADIDSRRRQLSAISGLRVGIAWQGNPHHKADRRRSISLALLAGALRRPGVCLISLQIGFGAEQIEAVAEDERPLDPFIELAASDFADTAAIIANLDLVIAVDSAVAHLSAAMGHPTWILLPKIGDWRWLRWRNDSPWYPTVRLFRQRALGGWAETLHRLAEALDTLAAKRGPS